MIIIAADDEPHALRNIERVVKNDMPDCTLSLFDAAKDALDYAKVNRVDVAFLDIEMSGMNGLALAKCLKELYGKTNIVFVTGYSEYALDAHALYSAGYLMKPITEESFRGAMENLRHPVDGKARTKVYVQTFGNFEVFVYGRPVAFRLKKAKEAFAFLVDRRGASVTAAEIAAILWEDREYNRYLQNQTQKIISEMMKTLRENGIEDIVVKQYNQISADTSKFGCDYYEFTECDAGAVNRYCGEYMSNYSWAEMTAAMLSLKAKIVK